MPRHISKREKVVELLNEIQSTINASNINIAIPLLEWMVDKIAISHNESVRSKQYVVTQKRDGKPRQLKRGTIYYARLGKNIGSEQNGYRPVLVVQNHTANFSSPNVTIIPLTDALDDNGNPKRVLSTHVELEHPSLKMKSLAKTEYIVNISKSRLIDEICNIGKGKMLEIEDKIKLSLGIRH